jgi:2-polyprenyl-6-methoxyphenol hydroxylase-like FAD-dependent oxidoreductase
VSEVAAREVYRANCLSFGEDGYILDRADLLRVLYETLDDKSRVLTSKRVTEVVSEEDGVVVKCADGSSYEGSLVIGADGIGSAARKAIRALALKAGTDADEERPFRSTYRMLWFSAPRPDKLPKGAGIIAFATPASAQSVCGDKKAWFFVYERLRKETNEKAVYTEKDIHEMVAKWGHLVADEGLRIEDLFATRQKAGLINLDEGIIKHWSGGRVVLVGDSVHKFTPSSALGYNNGVQDVAVALSEIVPLVRDSGNPSVEALGSAFARYKEQRTRSLAKDYEESAMATRSQTYDNFFLWVLCRLLIPYFGFVQKFLLNLNIDERLSKSRTLDFIPGTEPFSGKIPWSFPMKGAADKETK